MPYPDLTRTSKHDMMIPSLPSSTGLLRDTLGFDSTASIFKALAEPVPTNLKQLCTAYSLTDAPSPPISRGLIIIGVADVSLSVVRKLVGDEDDVPSCLNKCFLTVKRADGEHRADLRKEEVNNSKSFADFMRRMQRERVVAILSQDKYQRFAILKPSQELVMTEGEYQSEDFFGLAYVGKVDEVRDYLSSPGTSKPYSAPVAPKDESFALWQPPNAGSTAEQEVGGLWLPPGGGGVQNSSEVDFSWQNSTANGDENGFGSTTMNFSSPAIVDPWNGGHENNGAKRKRDYDAEDGGQDGYHADKGAAAADAFYSNLTRSLDTRADSRIFHMRAFNGWVKATQIQELDPRTKGPLRVLDLACGKGGDLGKWVLHPRGISNYVGIDVARGSLRDAAIRVRNMRNKLKRCTFTVADLGADVPGRFKSKKHKLMQKLLTWSLQSESLNNSDTPQFKMLRGGGISLDEKFDIVSIQFAIHYMMSSKKRARRFFQTVSELLEIGGNLIATTIDARVVLENMMGLGLNLHSEHPNTEGQEIVVQAGKGACKIRFEPEIVKRIFSIQDDDPLHPDVFGLEYAFTLVEGSDHAAGVGDAVNLPEWLTPIPVLAALGAEVGLELEYAHNFHEFYSIRSDPTKSAAAHSSLYNMKVLNRNGSISEDEWSISRLYAAIKFRKVRESANQIDDSEEGESDNDDTPIEIDPVLKVKLLPMAMMKAKKKFGAGWNILSAQEKQQHIDEEIKLLSVEN